MKIFQNNIFDLSKKNQWIFAFFFIVLGYVFIETRYPALNYDDTYHIGDHFPKISNYNFYNLIHYLFCDYNNLHNEFRTYGLARSIYYILYRLVGTNMIYYYLVMACMACLTVLLAAIAVKSITKSNATVIALIVSCLLGPFALFQTFWHAAYILMPFMFTVAYITLNLVCKKKRIRKILGVLLCVLITTTGEIATTILIAAIITFAISAIRTKDRVWLHYLIFEFTIIITVLSVLYGFYRLYIFNPELSNRFVDVDKVITGASLMSALNNFNFEILKLMSSSDAFEVIISGCRIDYHVCFVILVSILFSITVIVFAKEEKWCCSIRPSLFLIILYIASFVVYVAVASKVGIYYPIRYLQISGFLLIAAVCLLAASIQSSVFRKLILVILICLTGAGGILTFGMKVPTIESATKSLSAKITEAKAEGGKRVMFITPQKSIGFINPYKLNPASSALTEWWILQNYCPMIWGLQCTHGTNREPGDIDILVAYLNKGYMPDFKVEMVK